MNILDKNLAWTDHLPAGWHGLFRRLVADLAAVDPAVAISQAKQKFGRMRVYLDRYDTRADALTQAAETASCTMCEVCGEPGQLMADRGYYAALCHVHAGDAKPAPSPIVASIRIIPHRED